MTLIEICVTKFARFAVSSLSMSLLEMTAFISYRFVGLALYTIVLTIFEMAGLRIVAYGFLLYFVLAETYFYVTDGGSLVLGAEELYDREDGQLGGLLQHAHGSGAPRSLGSTRPVYLRLLSDIYPMGSIKNSQRHSPVALHFQGFELAGSHPHDCGKQQGQIGQSHEHRGSSCPPAVLQ